MEQPVVTLFPTQTWALGNKIVLITDGKVGYLIPGIAGSKDFSTWECFAIALLTISNQVIMYLWY